MAEPRAAAGRGRAVRLGVRNFYALVSFALCTFVTVTVADGVLQGRQCDPRRRAASNFLTSMIELTHRNTRRYGGYLVHVGVVMMFIGFTGKAFDQDKTVEVAPDRRCSSATTSCTWVAVENGQNENYQWSKLPIDVTKNGEDLGTLEPEHRVYLAQKQPTSEVAIRRRLE